MRKSSVTHNVCVEAGDRPIVDPGAASLELSELRHRTDNLLQTILGFLNLEAKRAEQAETKERLHDLALRVDLLANLHQRLNTLGAGDELNAGELIRHVAAGVLAPHAGRISLDLEVDRLTLDGRRAQSLALLVHEALTNVVRHAFRAAETGRVVVRARGTAQAGFTVEVEDNGQGMRHPHGYGGYGLRLMRALALRLGGDLQLQDAAPGLKLTAYVPPPEPVDPDPSSLGRVCEGQPARARRPRRANAHCTRTSAATSEKGLAHSTA